MVGKDRVVLNQKSLILTNEVTAKNLKEDSVTAYTGRLHLLTRTRPFLRSTRNGSGIVTAAVTNTRRKVSPHHLLSRRILTG